MRADRAGQMEAFVRCIQLGGFSRASRELGVTPSALSQLVSRLEDRLGVRLINRTTRKLSLTSEGQSFYALSYRVLGQLDDAEAAVSSLRDHPRGLLRVHTSVAFGLSQLSPALHLFLARYPDIQLELAMADGPVNVVEDEVDLYVGLAPQRGTMVYARKIFDVKRGFWAAPAYLERYGTPLSPDDFAHHNCIGISQMPEHNHWSFDNGKGVRIVEVSGNIRTSAALMALQLALDGVGIICLSNVLVEEHIRSGNLIPLLAPEYHAKTVPVYAVYAHGKHRSPTVEAMVSFLREQFSGINKKTPTIPRQAHTRKIDDSPT